MNDDGTGPRTDWRTRGQRILRRFADASVIERLLISTAALIMSVLVGALVVLASGWIATCSDPFLGVPGVGTFCYDPVRVYVTLVVGAFGSPFNVALTLKETTLLIFTGLSVAVAFRAGMFNIGTQGQLVLGALATALSVLWASSFVPAGLTGGTVLIVFGLLVGAIVGGVYGAIPGALKAYADANEVITTIMLNFVATGLAFVLVSEFFADPASQVVETRPLPDFALLRPIVFSGTFSVIALVFALCLLIGVYFLLTQTTFGYDLRTSGIQPDAAEYGGVDAERTMVLSMTLSGALGGFGGAVYVLMVLGRWQSGIPPIGFDGITVSILGANNPIGVVFAALLFGTLKSGSLAIDFALGVPKQLVGVLRGLIILFVAMPEFFRMVGIRIDDDGQTESVVTDGGTR